MAKLKDGFYKLTAEAVGSDSYMLLAGGGSKALSDFAAASGVVTALGINGNYVTWTKNGVANNLTVPYATTAGSASKWATARTLTIGNKGQSVNGTANVTWDLHDILLSSTQIGVSTSWLIYTPGVYYVASSSAFTGDGNPESANGGLTPYRYGQLIVSRATTGGVAQFYISHIDSSDATRGIKYRTGWNSTYQATWASILDSSNYTLYVNTTNFPGLNKTGTVTQVKIGSTAYNPSSGIVSLPAYPTSLPANGGTATNAKYLLTLQKDNTNFYSDTYEAYLKWESADTAAFKFNDGTYKFRADVANTANSVAWGNVTGKPSSYTPSAHDHTRILFVDDRNVVETPTDVAGKNGIEIHFKDKSKSSIPSTGTWTAVVMLDGYSDTSGGYPMELGFSMSDLSESRPLYLRTPKSATEWGSWRMVLDSSTYTDFINTTNFPGLNSVGDITGVTAGNGLTGGATSGTATLNVGAGTGITVNANDIAVKYGTTAGTACQGNDSRLSNARVNPNKLTIFGVEYDGSDEKTVTASTMIATLSEGTSNVTDNTEILTSYASNNGFADSNAPNTLYKRDAICLYNYINTKLAGSHAGLDKVGTVTSVTITQGTGITVSNSGTAITSSGTRTITLNSASSSAIGGVQLGYTASGANIPLQTSSNKGYVALTKTAVVAALGYTPPTSDTNTTYSAGTGISLSGTTFSNSGVRSTTINGNYLRVNTNGTNTDLTIPFATNATNANYFIGCNNSITVDGDANTYYPVVVPTTSNKKFQNIITVWKDLGSVTASYTGNHSNGTASMLYRYDIRNNMWDGNGGYCTTLDARYMYAPLVAETTMLGSGVGNFCIWLRGGGTLYNISTSWRVAAKDIKIHYSSINLGTTEHPVNVTSRTSIGNAGVYNSIVIPCSVRQATTASKLGSSTLGGTYEPIYLSSGTATKGTSYAKAIKGITRSGTTFTYTCIDGTTGTFTLLDNNSDTKVTQTVTSSNATYPLLLAPSGQTATTTTTACFDSGVTLNPSTNTITANITGNAATATTISGFTKRATANCTWGTLTAANEYSIVYWGDTASGGGIGFSDKGGKTYMQIDGDYYAQEGTKLVLHTGNSAVSGGGSTWGSSITVNIGGTSKTLTIPSNPNTHWTTRIYAGASGTAANAAATNPYLKITDDNTYRNLVRFIGGGATTVSSDANGNITISSTDSNTNTNYYHTRAYSSGLRISTGTGVSDMYVPTGTTSTLGVVKQHTAADCTSYTSDEGATTPAAVKKAIETFVTISRSLTSGTKIGTITINGTATELYCQTNTNTDTKVTQANTTTSANYRVLLSGTADDTDRTETARKSANLVFNPSTKSLIVPTVYCSDILTLNGKNSVYIQYNGDNTKSLVLNGSSFKPFDTSNNKITLGSTSARWSNTYSVLGNFSGQITSSVATGTSPFSITSTTVNTNLNADMLDGYHIWIGSSSSLPATKTNNTIYITI